MKKYLLLALFCLPVQAETYGLHLASYHTEAGHNNINPGAYVRTDGDLSVQAGVYRNSIYRTTAYVAGNVEVGQSSITIGAASGYLRPIIPMLVFSQRLDHWRLSYVPK